MLLHRENPELWRMEATETIIACKDGKKEEIVGEIADLIYHLTVEMAYKGVSWKDVMEELKKR